MRLVPGMHIHFTGVGGVGLSAIARVLLQRGFRVSGSDRSANALTDALARAGATIYTGHAGEYVSGADAVIVTSAAAGDHVEIVAAKAAGIPVFKRSEIINDVIHAGLSGQPLRQLVIAVAGTHGKTTTTSMIAHMLVRCGMNPGYIIGGVLSTTGTNAAAGGGDVFVIEADEYDNMFHGLRYDVGIVNNIDWDHPDFFKTFDDMIESFRKFVVDGMNFDCCTLINRDDAGVQQMMTLIEPQKLTAHTFGREDVSNVRTEAGLTVFDAANYPLPIRITRPGMHNAMNAVAALGAVSIVRGFNDMAQRFTVEQAVKALESFTGTGRRFEIMGETGGVIVINDYAHHPTAIRVTAEAAKMHYPNHQVWAVWQPHTYSRTQTLWMEYQAAFDATDHVLVTDIYAAREHPLDGVNSAALVTGMRHQDARYTPSFDDAADVLIRDVRAPAVILIMSAGDAPKIGEMFLQRRMRT